MAKKEDKKYLNFEMITMDVKVLKEELSKELKKEQPDEAYIEEILNYGAWGNQNKKLEGDYSILTKACKLLHTPKMILIKSLQKKYNINVVKSIIKECDINTNIQDNYGSTALHSASWQGHSQAVQEILKHPQIDPNVQNENGETALMEASSGGHSRVVQALLKHPKIDPNVQNNWGDIALHFASINGNSQVVEELLKHPSIDPNVKNTYGSTALHLASIEGHSQVVKALLKHSKTDPNVKTDYGSTALHLAIDYNHSQVVQALLNHPKTNIILTNERGQVAWDLAKPEIREQFPELNPIVHSIIKAKDKEIEEMKSLLEKVSAEIPENSKSLKLIKDLLS